MSRVKLAKTLRFFAIVAAACQTSHAQGLYTAQHLGPDQHAFDINDHGEMVGEHRSMVQQGSFFDGNRWIPRGNADDGAWSSLYGLNNNHVSVGLNVVLPSGATPLAVQAVRVDPDGKLVNLGSLTGENGNAKATAINDLNVTVGDSLNAQGKRWAVRFETNGMVTDLGTLGGESSSAVDINNRGDIAGDSLNANGQPRGFVVPWDGTMQDIGTLGGTETYVSRINSRGQIVGRSKTASGETHAFLYSDGEMKDLGTFGGKESAAYGINDDGVIVGGATLSNGTWTAFIQYPGKPMTDLAERVILPRGDKLVSAVAINNRGEIIVRGTVQGSNYLLRPTAFAAAATADLFTIRFSALPGSVVRIDSAEALPDWTPVSTNAVENEISTFQIPRDSPSKFLRVTVSEN